MYKKVKVKNEEIRQRGKREESIKGMAKGKEKGKKEK